VRARAPTFHSWGSATGPGSIRSGTSCSTCKTWRRPSSSIPRLRGWKSCASGMATPPSCASAPSTRHRPLHGPRGRREGHVGPQPQRLPDRGRRVGHPVRMAEEVATLAHISQGRLNLGIGRSGFPWGRRCDAAGGHLRRGGSGPGTLRAAGKYDALLQPFTWGGCCRRPALLAVNCAPKTWPPSRTSPRSRIARSMGRRTPLPPAYESYGMSWVFREHSWSRTWVA
jgi:Luciferase-like monooxygenase